MMLTLLGDVGGQKTLRSYWRNYFEKTDALIWVVDSTDRLRIEDCRDELHGLLQEEVSRPIRSFTMVMEAQLTVAAPCGSKSAHFCKQDRCGGLYDRT